MTTKSINTIVEDVLLCMDEADLNSAELIDGDDAEEVKEIIQSKLADAYRWANLVADEMLLEPEERVATLTGKAFTVPYSTLRVLGVKADDWNRYVSTFIRATDKAYAELSNPITTGTKDNPKVAVVNKGGTNGYSYELYSTDASKATYTFISDWNDTLDGTQNVNVSSRVYNAMVAYAAGLTFKAFKDAHGDALINQATTMIG